MALLVEHERLDGAFAFGRCHRSCRSRQVPARRDPHGGVEDPARYPERRGEDDPARRGPVAVGEALGEVGDVAQLGAPEAVDRLVGVACHREVAVGPVEALEEARLGDRGVLVLVDEDVPEPTGDLRQDLAPAEQRYGFCLEGAVVDAVALPQRREVAAEEPGEAAPVGALAAFQVRRGEQLLLTAEQEVAHLLGESAGGEHVAVAG